MNVACVFKVLQNCGVGMACRKDVTRFFIKRTVFLSRTVVRSVVNNISKFALHRLVCTIATLLGIKLLTNSNKFIHIVTLRHNRNYSRDAELAYKRADT